MARAYDSTEVRLEEFSYRDWLCTITLEASFICQAYWPGDCNAAPEGGEIELDEITIIQAILTDLDGVETKATVAQESEIRRLIRQDENAISWIRSQCEAEMEW